MTNKVIDQIRKLLGKVDELPPPDPKQVAAKEEYRRIVEQHAAFDPTAPFIRDPMREYSIARRILSPQPLRCICEECCEKRAGIDWR